MTAYTKQPLASVLTRVREPVAIHPHEMYKQVTVRLFHKGVVPRGEKLGSSIRTTSQWQVHQGDVLLSRIDARNGAIGIVPPELDGAIVTNDFWAFAVNLELVIPAFLDAYFGTAEFVDACKVASEGTTNRIRLQPELFLKVEVPLPSLNEQRRIVSRIEEIASKVGQARELRNLANAQTIALWASTLSSAYEPAGNALRTKSDACALLSEQANAHGDMPRTNFNGAHPWEPTIGLDGIYKLTEGWVWTDLGSVLTHLVDCINDTPDFATEKTGLHGLKSTNIRPYKLDLSQQWFVTTDDFKRWNRREKPQPGDIILTREAPMGNACLLPEGVEACLTQRLMLLRCDNSFVRRRYILHYLNTTQFKDEVTELCRGLTTPHIRVQDAPKLRVPLAPLPIQDLIITRLDALQEKLAKLSHSQSETAAELDALMPSILSHVFRGEL
jgi:type I restriction enzyme S subunit